MLVLLASLLGGCAVGPRHSLPTAAPAPAASAPVPVVPASRKHAVGKRAEVAAVKAVPAKTDFWQRLRSSFALGGCDGDAQVAAWIEHYTEHPRRFQARMRHDLPVLRYVADMTTGMAVPGEFALLPWIESNFRSIPARGDGPGGMWQIMPATGRALGLRIGAGYDGRLDIHESTASALQLLLQNHRALGDWRLADMAYNTGLYRIKRLLRERPDGLLEQAVPDLPVSQVTRDHLAKLSALGCIVRDPARYQLHLPEVIHSYTLVRVMLQEPLDLRIAAKLGNLSLKRVRSLNAGYVDLSIPATQLMLPRSSARAFRAASDMLDQWGWWQWTRVQVQQSTTLAAMVDDDSEQAELLARINALQSRSRLSPDLALWLPQPVIVQLDERVAELTIRDAREAPQIHHVRSGDTLWDIARRFHVRVAQLRVWNKLSTDLLQLGQTLRLTAP